MTGTSPHYLRRSACALASPRPGVRAERRAASDVDPDPEIERKSFQVADGFEVNLFAADPLLAKPIQMNFDPAGRLWVAMQRGLSADQARPEAERQDHRPRRHRGRRQGRQDHRLRRRAADPHRRRARRRRRLRRQQHRPAASLSDTDGDGKADRRARRALRLRHRGHAPHPPHAPLGPGRHALLQPVDLHPQPHRNAARRPRRLNGGGIWQFRPGDDASWTSSAAACGTRGAITWTAGANRSSPTAPAARASTTPSPAPPYATAVGTPRILPGPESRQPQGLRPGNRQRPALARRLAGQPHHQRFPRPSRLPLRRHAGRARAIRRKRCRNSSRRTTRRSGRST